MSHFKRFEYSSEDLKQNCIFQSKQEEELFSKPSRFDELLLCEWRTLMQNGTFKYKLDENLPTKYLPGKFAFLVQSNVMRYIGKRPSEIKDCALDQPFDSNKFNFTKISPKEILFELKNTDHVHPAAEDDEKSTNHVIINNSPIEFGHILICPRRLSCLNQVIDAEAFKLGLEISLLSSLNMISGFNSLNSHSSVNHLHIQAYYLKHQKMQPVRALPIQNLRKAEQFHNKVWFIDEENYFFPGFALQLCDFKNNIDILAKNCFKIVNYLHTNQIPHNVVIVKCEEFSENEAITTNEMGKITLRVAIWPKKPESELIPNDQISGFAICELAGHFLLPKNEQFNEITETDVMRRADECKMDRQKFEKVKNDLRNLTF